MRIHPTKVVSIDPVYHALCLLQRSAPYSRVEHLLLAKLRI